MDLDGMQTCQPLDIECAYCKAKSIPLQVEHIIPRSRGGTKRVSNLTVACEDCNQSKNNLTAAEFWHPNTQKKALRPLKDSATVNATRYAIGVASSLCGYRYRFGPVAGQSSIAKNSAIRKPTGLTRLVSVSPGIKSSLI